MVDDVGSFCLGEAGNPWAPRCMAQKKTRKGGGKDSRKSNKHRLDSDC